MLKTIKDGIKAFKEFECILQNVDDECKKTIASVRSNGVILEELKLHNYDMRNSKKKST